MKTLLIAFLCATWGTTLVSQETVVTGKLLGHDGTPMVKAHVHLVRGGQQEAVASVEAGKDGAYRLATTEQGLFRLVYTGAHHESYDVPLLAEGPVNVTVSVRLATYPYKAEITDVSIIGDFNNFSFGSARPMTKETDGTFTAEFESETPTFRYQILGVLEQTRSINGTQSDDYEYDGGGDYQSVINAVGGTVRIVFDPRKLVRSDTPAQAVVEGYPRARRLARMYASNMSKRKAFTKAVNEYRSAGKDMKDFSYDWSQELEGLAKLIGKTNDATERQYLLLSYLDLSTMAREGVDSTIALQGLKEIPFESPLWSLNPAIVLSAMYRAGAGYDRDAGLSEFVSRNKDRNLKAVLLFNQLMSARHEQKTELARAVRTMLVEEYGDTPQGKMARDRFPEESTIAVGKVIPRFAIASLEDPQVTFSNETLKGKVTLIDFWAVWCGPCIAEMDNLHVAYKRFKERNFQILSLSFDSRPEDVTEFRNKKWNMPWLHAFVKGGFNDPLSRSFEVIGIPKPILVDENGTILALEGELRGANLEKTLERLLER